DTVGARVGAIPEIGDSAEVKPVLNSAQKGGTYTQFRVQCKSLGPQVSVAEVTPRIQTGLSDLLLEKAIHVGVTPAADGTNAKVEAQLLFTKPPTEAETKTALESAGLTDV